MARENVSDQTSDSLHCLLGTPNEALDGFRQALLTGTLANALRTPFYRAHLAGLKHIGMGLEDLGKLPFVTKGQIRTAGRDARVMDSAIFNEVFTSGTTGVPFITFKGDKEQRYIAEFYNHVFAEHYSRPLVRALQINNPYHGHLVPVPVPMHSHKIGIYDDGSFEYGREVLICSHEDRGVQPRCTVLVGLERSLRAFTSEARRAVPHGLNAELTAVVSYSQFLTARWRRLHEETWRCPVIDRFGLSEVFGGATQDPDCGWWHFDPVCLPEVVGARSRRPIREGVGELVLTALYPFQQVQPMIRYLTGDLVEVTHSRSSRPGTLAIRPLGRIRYGVPHSEGDGFLLKPCEILEAVDSIGYVRRLPRFSDAAQVKDPFEIGHPCYATSFVARNGKTDVTLAVVAAEGSRGMSLQDRVQEALLDNAPDFNDAILKGIAELHVKVVEKLSPDLISHSE